MKKRWIFAVLVTVLFVGFVGWKVSQKKAEAAGQKKEREARSGAPVLVETVAASRRDVIKTFEAVGTVEAPQAVDLTPKVAGRILFLQAREGDAVTAGQTLVRIDPAEVQADVRQKQATLAAAQARLAQARITENPTNVGIQTEIRRNQATLTTAQAQSRQAQADFASQVAAANAAVTDAQGRIDAASAAIAQADAAIQTARANQENGRVKLDRQQTLFKEGATAKQNVDDAQTQYEVQQAAVNEALEKKNAAVASRDSARAQLTSARKQVDVVTNKAKADVAASGATVSQARAGLEAARANRAQGPAYQANLNALQAAVSAAEADVRAAQARLSDTTLASPLNGVVTQRNLDLGGLATPSQSVLTVQSIKQMWVNVGVPEEISRRIFQGQFAQVAFDALPSENYTGRIIQVYPAADPQSRQFTVRVRLENSKNRVKPGMFAKVSFTTESAKNAIVVPSEAVTKSGAEGKTASTVTIVGADNKAQIVPVETGLSDSKGIAITRGLEAGQKVVILAGRALKEGQALRTGDDKGKGGGRADKGGGEAGSAAGKGEAK